MKVVVFQCPQGAFKGPCRSAAAHGGNARGCAPFWSKSRSRRRTPGAWHQGPPDRLSSLAAPQPHRADPARRRAEFFLKVTACRLKNRSTELSVVRTPRSASRSTISARVRSGSCSTSSNSHAACGANGDRLLRPLGRRLTLPVCACNPTHRIDDDALTANRLAAARREHPSATAATTRTRRSSEYGCRPMAPLRIRKAIDSQSRSAENPQPNHNRFIRTGVCSRI